MCIYAIFALLVFTSAEITEKTARGYRHRFTSIQRPREIHDTMAMLRSTWFFLALPAACAMVFLPRQATAVYLDVAARGDGITMYETMANDGPGDVVSLADPRTTKRSCRSRRASPGAPSALSAVSRSSESETTPRASSSFDTLASFQGRCPSGYKCTTSSGIHIYK